MYADIAGVRHFGDRGPVQQLDDIAALGLRPRALDGGQACAACFQQGFEKLVLREGEAVTARRALFPQTFPRVGEARPHHVPGAPGVYRCSKIDAANHVTAVDVLAQQLEADLARSLRGSHQRGEQALEFVTKRYRQWRGHVGGKGLVLAVDRGIEPGVQVPGIRMPLAPHEIAPEDGMEGGAGSHERGDGITPKKGHFNF